MGMNWHCIGQGVCQSTAVAARFEEVYREKVTRQ